MTRSFTTREKILLVVLAFLVIGIGYFKLLLEPINDQITEYQLNMEAEESEIISNTAILNRMQRMQEELQTIYASGDAKPLPSYDNSDRMLVELNTILSRASDYSLNFGTPAALADSTYIVRRPISLEFTADSYETARGIIDDLHDSDNINQISDLSIVFGDRGDIRVELDIAYFELND